MVPQSKAEHEIAEKVAPLLLKGEQIVALGALMEKSKGQYALLEYDAYVVAATNLRLLLLDGSSRKHGAIKLKFDVAPHFRFGAHQVREWWYQDLQAVERTSEMTEAGWPLLIIKFRVRHPALGVGEGTERTYYSVAELKSLPSNVHFVDQFLPQLAEQVLAGTHPLTPARQAIVEQYEQAARARAQAQAEHAAVVQRKGAERAVQRQEGAERLCAKFGVRSMAGVFGVVALIALGLLGLLLGAGGLVSAFSTRSNHASVVSDRESMVQLDEMDVAWSEAGGQPPGDCSDEGVWNREELYPGFSSDDWRRETICHGCRVFSPPPTNLAALTGLTRFDRGEESWFCPPTTRYRAQLDADRARLERSREGAESVTGLVIGGAAVLFAFAPWAVALIVVVRGRRAGAAST